MCGGRSGLNPFAPPPLTHSSALRRTSEEVSCRHRERPGCQHSQRPRSRSQGPGQERGAAGSRHATAAAGTRGSQEVRPTCYSSSRYPGHHPHQQAMARSACACTDRVRVNVGLYSPGPHPACAPAGAAWLRGERQGLSRSRAACVCAWPGSWDVGGAAGHMLLLHMRRGWAGVRGRGGRGDAVRASARSGRRAGRPGGRTPVCACVMCPALPSSGFYAG